MRLKAGDRTRLLEKNNDKIDKMTGKTGKRTLANDSLPVGGKTRKVRENVIEKINKRGRRNACFYRL